MRAMHVSVTNHFNGRGRNATRNSKDILRGVAQEALDERQRVPLFDVSTALVVPRRTPQNVAIGNSIFDEEAQSDESVANGVVETPPAVGIERGSQDEIQHLATDTVAPDSWSVSANTPLIDNTGVLSESEEDSDEVSPTMDRSWSLGVLRRRPASETLCPNIYRLQLLRTNFAGDPDMQRELDQFILFREAGLAGGSASSFHTQGQASISADDGGVQFRPTALQSAIHGELINDLSDPVAITALVHYVDERFKRFRTRVACKDRVAAASIAAEFSTDHVLYTRLVQAAIQRRITAMVSAATTGYLSGKAPVRGGKGRIVRNPGGVPRKPQRTVPLEVLAALPKQNGKSLCMRYISKQGCRGQGETCIYEERGHFNHAVLPDIVREHIDENYGDPVQSTPKPENAEA
ncbi:hypothetical protein DVH05_025441 [Phytophthora capsici]|nr:hypothetical protein DVH05_025441 [Phytophthora capsici]